MFHKWIPQKMFAVDNETSIQGFLEVLTQVLAKPRENFRRTPWLRKLSSSTAAPLTHLPCWTVDRGMNTLAAILRSKGMNGCCKAEYEGISMVVLNVSPN